MKYALIIGNNKYDDQKLAQLKTPAADSQALAKILDDKTIGSFDEVTPLINQTETRVRRAISTFLTNKKPDDLVLPYFRDMASWMIAAGYISRSKIHRSIFSKQPLFHPHSLQMKWIVAVPSARS